METIQECRLKSFTNSLYAQFMNDVNTTIQEYTPETLRITKRYDIFKAALAAYDKVYKLQRKNNLTAELLELDKRRDEGFRCLYAHFEADLHSLDPERRKQAQYVINRLDSYDDPLRAGRRDESATLDDMGKALKEAPLSDYVSNLGQTDNLNLMIEANDDYKELSLSRTKSKKDQVKNATRDARLALDEAYRDIVAAVNSQVTYRSLVDEESSGSGEPSLPEVQSASEEADPLTEFIKVINKLIEEYKTTDAQSGSEDKPEDGEEGEGEEPETPEEGGEETEEPDDRPVVQ